MSSSRSWQIPASIVIAGAMIAVAVYLALRTRAPVEPTPEVGRAPGASSPAAVRPRVGPVRAEHERRRRIDDLGADEPTEEIEPPPSELPPTPPPGERVSEAERAMAVAPPLLGLPPVPDELRQRVEADARAAFEGARDELRRECWDALPADPAAPEAVSVTLSLSYDAEGHVLASGVAEDRRAARAGVASCLGPRIHELSVPPPGTSLGVEVVVELP